MSSSAYIQVGAASASKPEKCDFFWTLKAKEISAAPALGVKKDLADVTLVGLETAPAGKENSEPRTYEVSQKAANAVLKESGKSILADAKCVLIINGTCTLDPPNFKAMLSEPESITKMGQVFGTLEGCIIKNFVTACWSTCGRCGGIYFFTSEEAVDEYLGSELWANIAETTPWADITYEKYEVASKM